MDNDEIVIETDTEDAWVEEDGPEPIDGTPEKPADDGEAHAFPDGEPTGDLPE
jgi:hypothetical protein